MQKDKLKKEDNFHSTKLICYQNYGWYWYFQTLWYTVYIYMRAASSSPLRSQLVIHFMHVEEGMDMKSCITRDRPRFADEIVNEEEKRADWKSAR